MNNKLCGLLGIARRSGHILIGFDAVRAALLAGKTQLILLASDCSPKTEKELRFAAEGKNEIHHISTKGWIPREPTHPARWGHRIASERLTEALKEYIK